MVKKWILQLAVPLLFIGSHAALAQDNTFVYDCTRTITNPSTYGLYVYFYSNAGFAAVTDGAGSTCVKINHVRKEEDMCYIAPQTQARIDYFSLTQSATGSLTFMIDGLPQMYSNDFDHLNGKGCPVYEAQSMWYNIFQFNQPQKGDMSMDDPPSTEPIIIN